MRKRIVNSLAAGVVLLLAGCGSAPQNAEEFRQQIPGAFMGKVQTFEANRPMRDIGKTFAAKAPECLNVSVRTVVQSSTSYQNILATYKPTVLVSDKKVELHVQRHYDGVVNVYKEPAGGHFMLVADVTPIDRNRSRIDIYGPSHGADVLVKAIMGWATGQNLGCPDMSKN
jgi:hypothetical protein